ncbi:probable leucine-rich repeat receptor-like protein kinase At1g35710 [Pistacia vera]|uniref:probable leucine-rich repeat receptor-like protein kinase At1g35710 n=1 Tax=Pistacia vera TaxID=55513 RepID=UPI001262CB05|nr:probable leucine-rich repeat receptor-like protein kinase At1g35710 [Pistacia vera]
MNKMTYASFLLRNLIFLVFCRYLFFNKLSGAIPHELGELSQLQILFLDDNELNGTLTEEIGNLRNLQVLWVTSNYLTGKVPEVWRRSG